jgi:hypothetical protein
MRNLIISLIVIAIFLEISGLIWSAKSDRPSDVYVRLTQPPERKIDQPFRNGYFLLLGFTASANADPVRVGYEIWREAQADRGRRYFDQGKPGRAQLRLMVEATEAFPAWQAIDPVAEFQKPDALLRTTMDRYSRLLERYEQFLAMPFEDWGYGHVGSPRLEEFLTVHRLYIGQGFGQQFKSGLDRLQRDLIGWRTILAEARTPVLKMMAAVLIDDDVALLTKLLSSRPDDNKLGLLIQSAARPLTPAEYSLRWPIEHQFVLGTTRSADLRLDLNGSETEAQANREWVARRASLPSNAFTKVEHPAMKTALGMTLESQRMWDTYAAYYDVTIKAVDTVHSPLPKLQDVTRASQRTLLETLLRPLEFEPDWDQFSQRLIETDARLRVLSLQVLLRKPSVMKTVPGRLAEVGPAYYDPFTGLPMLWSATQGKVYSIGKDHIDDGGDSSFDISAPATLGPAIREAASSNPAAINRASPLTSPLPKGARNRV